MLEWVNGQPPPQRAHPRPRRRPRRQQCCAIEPLEKRQLLTFVAVYGDQTATNSALAVANMMKGWNPEYIVSVGDNYYDADPTIDNTVGRYFHDYVSPYTGSFGAGSPSGNRFWSAVGNHEYENSPGAIDYYNYFTFPGNERYYKLSQGNIDWFFVNSNPEEPDGNTVGSVQYNWLQSQMTASTATWKLVVFHHPAYSSGDSAESPNMRWPFKDWGASAVFSGHHHIYERLNVDGLPYFIDGLGGASIQSFAAIDPNSQVRYEASHGAMLLDVQATTLNFKFFNQTGVQIDNLTINAPTPPAAPTKLIAGAVSASQIDLSWADNSNNEANFILERSPDGTSNWAQIATPAANATTFSDTTVQSGLTYFYRVRSFGGSPSADSNISSATSLQNGYFNWISRGTTWKYLDTGVDQGAAWRAIAFNDTSWLGGRGQFGYGDGDETTIVSFGPNSANKFPTTYFRKSFSVADPNQVIQLDLRLLRDDGAVVYLNGTEVWRDNMPVGTISYGTLASSQISGAAENTSLGLTISPALLVAGANVLAVEIHQDSAATPDASFDMTLGARMVAPIPPPSGFRATANAYNQVGLSWIDTVIGEDGFKIERSIDGVNFTQIGLAPADATTYTDNTVAGTTQYWYRARSYNASLGDSRASSVSNVTTPVDPATILPSPWTRADVGAVAAAGSSTHNSGVFTLNGSGAGIAGTADEFHFVSQPWNGSGTITARVNSISNTNAAAKAGVMFRETTATGAKEVCITVTPAGTIVVLGRAATNGSTAGPPIVTGITTPIWIRMVRNVNMFTGQYSTNGTTWQTIPGASFTLTTAVLVGMCVTSNNDGVLATGTFDNVSVTTSVSLTSAGNDGTTPPPPQTPPSSPHDKWKKINPNDKEDRLKKDLLDLLA